ncbi:MFS transporter [Streptomyces sp. AV19]|uniref:MFS transporter n=2 Tax=Streptomyces sp. AV19 TaxID=2793068 RepID=UPI0018FEFCA3|nr:MFS transporter [Streptomyces sp. AV19]MBH1935755.1 MFS transporter [Streptomyces sp. AV19]
MTMTRVAAVQKRTLMVLAVSQIIGGAGIAAGITVGALLAEEVLGSTGLAGLPSALFTGGSAFGAVAVGRMCERWGRRPGLAVGHALASLGSVGVVLSATAELVAPLMFSLLVYGAGTSANLMARYAGADLAPPERRGRAVSAVLLAMTLGAVVGPTLATVTGDLARDWGLPRLTGPFLLASVVYAVAALVLFAGLRPDPLRLAKELADRAPAAPAEASPAASGRTEPRAAGRRVALGTSVLVLNQLVKVAIMTMTPVYMNAHGHGVQATAMVIAVHVGAMFLPSPLTGVLVDRYGQVPTAVASGLTLLVSCLLVALAPADDAFLLGAALVLLALGWNFALVSGTAIVTDAVPLARRASTQGMVDVGISVAGATGALVSGPVVAGAGFPVLAAVGGAVALAIVPLAVLTVRDRPAPAGPRPVPAYSADSAGKSDSS